jgi:hypothetical protein
MRNVCGEMYLNVLRDNERADFLEEFMIRKLRRPNKAGSKRRARSGKAPPVPK